MLTYDEHRKRAEDKRADVAVAHRPQLEMLRQAAVSASSLTGDRHWDVYLQYLAAAIEDTEEQEKGFMTAMADPAIVDHEAIMKAKLSMAECAGRIKAWRAALSLPKDIMGMGAQAKTLLERMEKT